MPGTATGIILMHTLQNFYSQHSNIWQMLAKAVAGTPVPEGAILIIAYLIVDFGSSPSLLMVRGIKEFSSKQEQSVTCTNEDRQRNH